MQRRVLGNVSKMVLLSCSQRQPHVYTVYMFKSLFESIMIHAIVPYYQALLLMQGRSAQFKNLKHNLIMFSQHQNFQRHLQSLLS